MGVLARVIYHALLLSRLCWSRLAPGRGRAGFALTPFAIDAVTSVLPGSMHALDALGSPVRRAILRELRVAPLSVGDLAARFPVSRPAVSRHLRMLELAGLVEARTSGARHLYGVRMQGFAPVRDFLDEFWDTALARLDALAKE